MKLVLVQKSFENLPCGERAFENGFIIDHNHMALSAGKALWDMLRKDPETEEREATPLFSNKTTVKEVSYE